MTLKEILDYEIRSSWWASWITVSFIQRLAGKYFAWKSMSKFKRYKRSLEMQSKLIVSGDLIQKF